MKSKRRNTANGESSQISVCQRKPDTFVIEGTTYTLKDVMTILKAHEKGFRDKLHYCGRCGASYETNSAVPVYEINPLPRITEDKSYAMGAYCSSSPVAFISGFKTTSTHNTHKEISLCDDCAKSLSRWFNSVKLDHINAQASSSVFCSCCGKTFTSGMSTADGLVCDECLYNN